MINVSYFKSKPLSSFHTFFASNSRSCASLLGLNFLRCRYYCQIWFLGNFGLRSSALTAHSDPWVFCLEVVDLLSWFIECVILLSCGIFTVWKTFCAYYHLPHAFNLFWVILQGPSPWYPSTSEHNADIHSVRTADAQLLLILTQLCYVTYFSFFKYKAFVL